MNKVILLSIVALILFSCRKSKPSRAIDDSGMTEIVLSDDSTVHIQDWVQDVEVIPLESSGNILVGTIDGVIVTDDHIIIYDERRAHSVFIFGWDGKHRATINRRGRGPQEYIGIHHVALLPDNRTIAINDNIGKKVLHFSLDGRFISSTPSGFWFSAMEYLNEDNLVCAAYGTGETDPGLEGYGYRNDLVYFTDQKYQVKGSALPQRYNRGQMVITPIIRKFGDQVYTSRPFSDTIYQATQNGLKAIYRIEMEKIGGAANFDPSITRESFDLLQEKKATFFGDFTDANNHLNIPVTTPPQGVVKSYLYSKRSGKVYTLDHDGCKDDIILWQLTSTFPRASVKEKFVAVVPAFNIITAGLIDLKTGIKTSAVTQRPELANLTENSNPVIVLYGLKEGL